MRILAIHRYFWPDTPPYASFLRSIGGRWAAEGHHVEILTARPTFDPNTTPAKKLDDLSITRVPVAAEDGRNLGQMLNLVFFPIQIAWKIIFGPHRDVVMCSTAPQVTLGFAVSVAAKIRRTKFVYHCMDLHPEIGQISGEFANPIVRRVFAAMDLATMRRASRIIVLSEDMRVATINRDQKLASKLLVINNFALPDYEPRPQTSPIVAPPNGTLRIVFTGNLGRFQGLETAVNALRLLPPGKPVELVFMGHGKAERELKEAAGSLPDRAYIKVTFIPQGSPAEAKALMREAHLGLVSLTPGVVRFAYPSKTATYAREALPLLVACEQDSQLARMVREQNLGLTVPPGDAAAMAKAFNQAREWLTADGIPAWKSAITKYSEVAFDESNVLDCWSELINELDENRKFTQ